MNNRKTSASRFRPLEAGEFITGIRKITIAALVVVPFSGIVIMTFLGVYPWPDLLYVLGEYSGIVIAINVFLILMLSNHLSRKIVDIVENDKSGTRDSDIQTLLKRVPFLFFGVLLLYTLQGAVSANLSLEHFEGYQYDASYYAYTFYGTIPTLLISSFPIYFYLVDYMGRYLAPRGIQVRIAPLSVKLAILGLFTPVLIDTVLLLYYYDRTRFLTIETISLWFGLLIIAGIGSRLAWNSMRQSLFPLEQFADNLEMGNSVATEGPVPRSLDELGSVSLRLAGLLLEARKLDNDLAHEKQFVNAVLENANALILVLDKEGRICRFNRACEQYSGYKFEEVRDGYPWDYFLDPKEKETVRKNAFETLAKNPQNFTGRYTNYLVGRDGTRYLVDWFNSVLLGKDGKMEYLVSIGTDVTEKDKNEKTLIESHQLHQSLLSLAQELEICRSNSDVFESAAKQIHSALGYTMVLLYLLDEENPRYCNLSGVSSRLTQRPDPGPDEMRLDMQGDRYLGDMLASREILIVDNINTDPRTDKERAIASGFCTTVNVPLTVSGRPFGFICMVTFQQEGPRSPKPSELTFLESLASHVVSAFERIRYEGELARYRDHLEELVESRTRELKQAQVELVRRERLSTLGQLTATVSHELRNPLGAMRSSTFILRQKLQQEDDPAVIRAVDRVERGIERCDHIIDELLDFTRITSLDKSYLNFDRWVATVIKDQSLPNGVRLESNLGLDGLHVDFDPHRLRRALINIIDNAVQAMIPNGEETPAVDAILDISTRVRNGRIELVVRDNGAGISQEVLPRIFEPLFSTKNFGVGLGMPAVKQIMMQHDGGIEIDSKPGQGTIVILWLPMSSPDSSASDAANDRFGVIK